MTNLEWYERAAVIPGRSLTRSKAPGRLFPVNSGGPLYASHGEGAVLFDAERRPYIDMLCALGAVSLGYSSRPMSSHGGLSLPHVAEVEAAEAVLEHVAPWASSVRFVKTGSEATHAAYLVARTATGRKGFLRGDWSYHGWHSWIEDYGQTIKHGEVLGDHEGIAAVFIEPHRWEPVDVEWLQSVRAFCDRVGALLVFDSMILGGRWALGGASEYFGVQPDLECYGKAFGNGQSVAFVVGNEALAAHGEMVSGTYSGDVVGLEAVTETIKTYTDWPVIKTLWARGTQLQHGLDDLVKGRDDVFREGQPVHQRLRFIEAEQALAAPYDYRIIGRPRAHGFAAEMAKRGVLWHPDVCNIMYAHTADQIARVIEAAGDSLKAIG